MNQKTRSKTKPTTRRTVAESAPTQPLIRQKSPQPPTSRTVVWVALGLCVVWLGLLTVLVLTTSNPVHLNELQILQSDYIVTAQVVDAEAGKLRIENVIRFSGFENFSSREITVPNLPEGRYRKGELYLVPLRGPNPGRVTVTQPDVGKGDPLPARVYPATEEVLTEVDEILHREPLR